MKREILLEERVKVDLGITCTRRRSSFASLLDEAIAKHNKHKTEENKRIQQQLQYDKEMRASYNATVLSTGNTSGTFMTMPSSAAPIQQTTVDTQYLRDLRQEALTYRRERDELRQRLERLEEMREEMQSERQYLEARAEQYQQVLLEQYNKRVQPMIIISKTNYEGNMDETTPEV